MTDAEVVEREIRIVLRSGHVVVCRISVASTIIVGPGPRPKRRESLLASRIDDERVLTTSVEIEQLPEKAEDGESGDIESREVIPLGGNQGAFVVVSIASTFVVGPGPRPRLDEAILIRRIDEQQVLTVSTDVGVLQTASIHVGTGGPVGGGSGGG